MVLWAHEKRKGWDRKAGWSAFKRVTESLTNWQRNQWAKAGYPGLRQRDASKINRFAEARR